MYRDEYWITEYAVMEDPKAWWAWHCKAMKRWDAKSYMEAIIFWTMARLISPNEFKVLINLATAFKAMGNDKEGDSYLAKAMENVVPGQEETAQEIKQEFSKGRFPILL